MIFLQPINDGVVLLVFGLTSLGPGTHSLDLGLWCRVLGVTTTSRRCYRSCSGPVGYPGLLVTVRRPAWLQPIWFATKVVVSCVLPQNGRRRAL